MNKSLIIGAVLGAGIATAGGAISGFNLLKGSSPAPAANDAIMETTQTLAEPADSAVENVTPEIATPPPLPVEPAFAEVVRTVPVTKTTQTPREECHEVVVTRQRPVQDESRVAGKVLGAVVGGVLGSKVGKGKGKKAATVAGALAGGYAGDRVQDSMQKGDTYQDVEQQCQTVYDSKTKTVGYDVTYRLDGVEKVIRMSYDPGRQIPMKDGQLVLTRN